MISRQRGEKAPRIQPLSLLVAHGVQHGLDVWALCESSVIPVVKTDVGELDSHRIQKGRAGQAIDLAIGQIRSTDLNVIPLKIVPVSYGVGLDLNATTLELRP